MQSKNKKRSSAREIARSSEGVGGRQASSIPSAGGGGYLNKCTVLNFDPDAEQKKRDPRLDELREMGLPRPWVEVGEAIGVDALMKTWRILDRDQSSHSENGRMLVPMRRYSTFLRYQRNRYIEALNSQGMKPKEIREKINAQLGEQLSLCHILRITKQG